jgi:hypothetical protein
MLANVIFDSDSVFSLGTENVNPCLYRRELTHSDFPWFGPLKEHLAGQKFDMYGEL